LLTKRYFERFAQIFAENPENIEDLKMAIIAFFIEDNPRFDGGRFFERVEKLQREK